jgi:hypothetical protein
MRRPQARCPPARHLSYPQRPPLGQMTPADLLTWVHTTRMHLERKQTRERASLDCRAVRGTCTPTDEVYEQDQLLESDLIAFLNEREQQIQDDGNRSPIPVKNVRNML